MSCICCTSKLDLGCLTTCGNLTISYTSPTTETYTLVVEFDGQIIEINAAITSSNELVFDISELNEMYTFYAKVRNEAGDILSFIDGSSNIYDCFLFKTIIGLTVNQPSINLTLAP